MDKKTNVLQKLKRRKAIWSFVFVLMSVSTGALLYAIDPLLLPMVASMLLTSYAASRVETLRKVISAVSNLQYSFLQTSESLDSAAKKNMEKDSGRS